MLVVLSPADWLAALAGLTGARALVTGLHRAGAGMHITRRGGALQLHADFEFAERLCMCRRSTCALRFVARPEAYCYSLRVRVLREQPA